LWYSDSASINYPRSDSLVLAFWLAETCVNRWVRAMIDWQIKLIKLKFPLVGC
jgi:hypothetical protein